MVDVFLGEKRGVSYPPSLLFPLSYEISMLIGCWVAFSDLLSRQRERHEDHCFPMSRGQTPHTQCYFSAKPAAHLFSVLPPQSYRAVRSQETYFNPVVIKKKNGKCMYANCRTGRQSETLVTEVSKFTKAKYAFTTEETILHFSFSSQTVKLSWVGMQGKWWAATVAATACDCVWAL